MPTRSRLWIAFAGAVALGVLTSAAAGRAYAGPDLAAVALALLLGVPAGLIGLAIGVLAATPQRAIGWLCGVSACLAGYAGAGCLLP
jgi:hypothetical protein